VSALVTDQRKILKNELYPDENYFPVCPDTLNPHALTDFQVYLKRGQRYVLYTRERQYFSQKLKQRLVENGINTVYIPYHQRPSYDAYMIENLEWILNDPEVPVSVRSKAFMQTTTNQVKKIYERNMPALDNKTLENVTHVVRSSLCFLATPEAMENIGRFISHDYQTFTHGVQVFTYTMMLMHRLEEDWSEQTLIDAGVGALLHDIGKTNVSSKILNKTGALNEQEWKQILLHPVHGMRMCTSVDISRVSLNCIVFHHEK
jgi:HD-GYP domain-containing protein (c-di-GMP phosphodiesterase class II)